MDFTYDEEQQALRDAVRGLVGKSYADYENRRRAVAEDPGFDEKLWARLAEMGVLGLPFAEADGGMGAGPIEVGIVAQELGRVIAPEPFLASVVLAGGVVCAAGTDDQRAEVLGALASGESVLAFAHAEPGGRWAAAASDVKATGDGTEWTHRRRQGAGAARRTRRPARGQCCPAGRRHRPVPRGGGRVGDDS